MEKAKIMEKEVLIEKIQRKEYWVPNNNLSKFGDYPRGADLQHSFHCRASPEPAKSSRFMREMGFSMIDFQKMTQGDLEAVGGRAGQAPKNWVRELPEWS